MSLGLQGIPGRNLLPFRSGYGAQVLAGIPDILPIGAAIDWNLVAAAGANVTLPDTELILSGWRYLRYGQVMTRVTGAAANILTISGTPTGGTFAITATNSATGASTAQATAGIPFNATALQVKAALEALNDFGAGNVIVTGGPTSTGGVYNLTPAGILGATTFTVSVASLTGGTPAGAFSAGAGGNSRYFGPYDSAATDGRQTVARDDCFILNRTHVMGGSLQLPLQDDIHTSECVIGGNVWGAKVIATNGTHSLANGPTWTELLAALPKLQRFYV